MPYWIVTSMLLDQRNSFTNTYGYRAFSLFAPRLWNNLLLALRRLKSADSFKGVLHLKKIFFFAMKFQNRALKRNDRLKITPKLSLTCKKTNAINVTCSCVYCTTMTFFSNSEINFPYLKCFESCHVNCLQ